MSKKTIEALNQLLSDSFVLYAKTLNFHWHVRGPNFSQLHELFEQQYTDLAGAIDEIAERVVILGGEAVGSMKGYLELTSLKEASGSPKAAEMVEILARDQELLVKTCYQVVEVAESENDQGSVDLAVARSRVHEKNGWMLKSTVG